MSQFLDYIDWSRSISSSRSSVNFVLKLDPGQGENHLTNSLEDMIKDITGLKNLPGTWVSPDQRMPGFEILVKFLRGNGHKSPAIGVAIDSQGMIAISITVDGPSMTGSFDQAVKYDNIALIVAHLIKRSVNETFQSKKLKATEDDTNTSVYRVHAADPAPIPLENPKDMTDDKGDRLFPDLPENATDIGVRAGFLLKPENLIDLKIREYANTEAISTTPVALLALSRRRLRLRDRLLASIDTYSESFRRAQRTKELSTRLAVSIVVVACVFLGVLLSETFVGAVPISSRLDGDYFTLLDLVSLGVILVVALWLVVFPPPRVPRNIFIGVISFLTGAVLPRLIAKLTVWVDCALANSQNGPNHAADGCDIESLISKIAMDSNEAVIFAYVLLIVALLVLFGTAQYQTIAERQHQLATSDRNFANYAQELGSDRVVERAKYWMLACLILAPIIVFVAGYLLFELDWFPDATGDNVDSDPKGAEEEQVSNSVVYTDILRKIGWALPVLSLSILAQVWNRFAESGALTLIHDVTLTRLNQIEALIKAESEFIDRIKTRYATDSSDVKPDAVKKRALIAQLPNMSREAEVSKQKEAQVTAMKTGVYGEFVGRSALVAASVIVLLQIPPLRQMEPNDQEESSPGRTIAKLMAECNEDELGKTEPCLSILNKNVLTGSVQVHVNGTPHSKPIKLNNTGVDISVDISAGDGNASETATHLGHFTVAAPTPIVTIADPRTMDGALALSASDATLTFTAPAAEITLQTDGDTGGAITLDNNKLTFAAPKPDPVDVYLSLADSDGDKIKLSADNNTLSVTADTEPRDMEVILVTEDPEDGSIRLNDDGNILELVAAPTDPVRVDVNVVTPGDSELLPSSPDGQRELTLAVAPTVLYIDGPTAPTKRIELDKGTATVGLEQPEVHILLNPELANGSVPAKITQTNGADDVSTFDVGMQIELTGPEQSPTKAPIFVQNYFFSGDVMAQLPEKNALLLPLFPEPVEGEPGSPIESQADAFEEGLFSLRDELVFASTIAPGTRKPISFLVRIADSIAECVANEDASVEIDVLGFASQSWPGQTNEVERDNYNHALAEGRRMAVLRKIADSIVDRDGGIQVRDRIQVRVANGKPVSLSTILAKYPPKMDRDNFSTVAKIIWESTKNNRRFSGFETMKKERDFWMSKVAEPELAANPFEELFARSALVQVLNTSGPTDCKIAKQQRSP